MTKRNEDNPDYLRGYKAGMINAYRNAARYCWFETGTIEEGVAAFLVKSKRLRREKANPSMLEEELFISDDLREEVNELADEIEAKGGEVFYYHCR